MYGYMIADGEGNFIRHDPSTNKFVPINDKRRGTIWTDRKKVDNVYKSLSKAIRPRFYVTQIVVAEEDNPVTKTVIKPAAKSVCTTPCIGDSSNMDYAENCKSLSPESFSSASDANNPMLVNYEQWRSRVEDVLKFINDAENQMTTLSELQRNADQEISDIEHYMEFNQLNAYQGYLAYRRMREVLLRRRAIKNEMKVVQAIRHYAPVSSEFASVLKAIDNMDTQQYRPRILSELFK